MLLSRYLWLQSEVEAENIFEMIGPTKRWSWLVRKTFQRCMKGPSRSFRNHGCGLDIHPNALTMVKLEARGRPVWRQWAVRPIDGPPLQDDRDHWMRDVLREFVGEYHLTRTRVAVGVSGPGVCVRVISVPRMSSDELDAHLAWEIDKYIPYNPEDVYWDFHVQGEAEASAPASLSVLLAVAKKEIVDRRVALLNDAGLEPVVIDVDGVALSHVYLQASRDPELDHGAVLWVNGDPGRLTMVVMHRHGIVLVRDAPVGTGSYDRRGDRRTATALFGGHEPDADRSQATGEMGHTVDDMVQEISRTLHYTENVEAEVPVTRVLLSGEYADFPNVAGLLAARLARKVEIVDPFHLGMIQVSTLNGARQAGPPRQTAIAAGLALRALAP